MKYIIYAIFFLSGVSGLIYQILWTRSFSLIFGSTVYSLSSVSAAFLAGLALGAYLVSKYNQKISFPLRLYAILEIGIGILAGIITWGLFVGYSSLGALLPFHPTNIVAILIRPIVVFLLLLLPTVLMGATLPILVEFIKNIDQRTGRFTGNLYGFNTFGAAVGSFIVSFIIIRLYNLQTALAVACALNFLSGIIAFVLYKKLEFTQTQESPAQDLPENISYPSYKFVMWITFFIGFSGMAYEILWFRLLLFFIGNRIYAVSLLLTAILAGIALGSILLGRWSDQRTSLFGWLGAFQVLVLIWVGAVVVFFPNFFAWQSKLESLLPLNSHWAYIVIRMVEILFLVLPPTLISGICFPLVIHFVKQDSKKISEVVAKVYTVNTIGCILGSLLTGFLLVKFLGTNLSFLLILTLNAFIASFCFWKERQKNFAFSLGIIIALAVLIALWIKIDFKKPFWTYPGEKLVASMEDEYGLLTISQTKEKFLRLNHNGTNIIYLLGHKETSFVQEMQAYFPMLFVPQAKNIAVIGSGYGITAGAFTLFPKIEKIDAIEILPGVFKLRQHFSKYNFNYDKDPRVKLVADDGRSFLQRSSVPYDIISINVVDPYLPGSSCLYTQEFYQLCKQKLAKNGVIIQHVFGPDSGSIIHTMLQVFPHFYAMKSYKNGFNIVASSKAIVISREIIEKQVMLPKVHKALNRFSIKNPTAFFVSEIFNGTKRVERGLKRDKSIEVISDLNPFLEFRFISSYKDVFHSNF